MGQVLYPPTIADVSGSIIFLAGPIQGAPQWQERAIKIIQELSHNPIIACPRRLIMTSKEFDAAEYNLQVDWETHYLRKAGLFGVVMFYLAKEIKSEHSCDRAYAQTTRFELSEWKMRHERDNTKLAIGIERGFTNEKYIRRRFGQDCPDINICNSLRDTCEEAVRLFHE